MQFDLPQFYASTGGGKTIPHAIRPYIGSNFSHAAFGQGKRLIAQGLLHDKGNFKIYQQRPNEDMWMEICREDGSVSEWQSYHPRAVTYSFNVTSFDEFGTLVRYAAQTYDGRLVEEVVLNDKGKMERTMHHYPDTYEVSFRERQQHANTIKHDLSIEKHYQDEDGSRLNVEKFYAGDNSRLKEVYYHQDGTTIRAIVEFQPGKATYKGLTVYTKTGLLDSEQQFDNNGQVVLDTHYFTKQIANGEPKKRLVKKFEDNILKTEMSYHPDGTLRAIRDYETDGKTLSQLQKFNSTGEFPLRTYRYKNGKVFETIIMEMKGDEPKTKRIIFYDENGKPYRSRERHDWHGEDEFWADTEIDRKTGHPLFTIMQTPTGLVRQEYDPDTGRLSKVENYREESLGETLELATYYHPAKPRTSHPEDDDKLIISRVENYDGDGESITASKDYRGDGSIKFRDEQDSTGDWIRKAYPPGTYKVEDDTPVIFESVRSEDKILKSSTLRGHSDPSIITLHKEYDDKGKVESVRIETLDGEEELSWREYTDRKIAESKKPNPGPVKLATITPDIRNGGNFQVHYGKTSITLQGTPAALKKAYGQLYRRFPEAKFEMGTGERKWLQYRGLTGHYVANDPTLENHPLLEKVDVLHVTMPYNEVEGDKWPVSFSENEFFNDDAKELRQRGIEEAAEALKNIFRYISCDLGLNLLPLTGSHEKEDGKDYIPYVRMSWPNKPYLPPAQCHVISEALSDIVMKKGFISHYAPGGNNVEVYTSDSTGFTENVALLVAKETAQKLAEGLIPASVRQRSVA
jgi:uncharacterized protein YkuJ